MTQRDLPRISLTSFADVVLRTGIAKYNAIKRIRQQYEGGYSQRTDYYKRFREAIRLIHSSGQPVAILDELIEEITEPSRRTNYELLARGYKRFWTRCFQESELKWTHPKCGDWQFGGLTVKVNPELAFASDSELIFIKLYFKKEPLKKAHLGLIQHLLQIGVSRIHDHATVALLDVRRGRLFEATAFDRRLTTLLKGEARSFVEIWQALEPASVVQIA